MSHAYGRIHVAEPLRNLTLIHRHQGETLREVDHEPPLAVLEQENFSRQGIDTSTLVPGAPKVDELGNCVYNAGTAAVSCLGDSLYNLYIDKLLGPQPAISFTDSKLGEEAAIIAYHDGAKTWPPQDGGSSGVALATFLTALGVISSQRIAHGAQDIVSLLQSGPVLEGTPFFNAWEQPNASGFVDGDGSQDALEAALRSGVAGGHETLICAIEKLSLSATGIVEPQATVLRVRNSWAASWGDHGDFRIHLSTLVMLGAYADFRQLVA